MRIEQKQSIMNFLRVNDLVQWSGDFGKEAPQTAKVLRIEVNCFDAYGTSVNKVDWQEVDSRKVVVDLDNGQWAYGFQISQL